MRSVRIALVALSLTKLGLCQTADPEVKIQQEILDEIRGMRRDAAVAANLQLLIAELQLSQTSIDRVLQRREAQNAQLQHLTLEKSSAQADLARVQTGLDNLSDATQKAETASRVEELEERIRGITLQEKQALDGLQNTETQLRVLQAERDNVQSQLGELVKQMGHNH